MVDVPLPTCGWRLETLSQIRHKPRKKKRKQSETNTWKEKWWLKKKGGKMKEQQAETKDACVICSLTFS